jgi:hypothetical protein
MSNPTAQLFNRAWALTIGVPFASGGNGAAAGASIGLSSGSSVSLQGNSYANSPSATIPYSQSLNSQQSVLTATGKPPTGLRVEFDIDKGSISSPNKATIKVYNFSSLSRLNYQAGYQVQLQAGYFGLMSTIYIGDIPSGPKAVSSERRGAEIITTMECATAEKQLIYGFFDQSYPSGTPVSKIISDIANQFGLAIGSVTGLQNKVFNNGYTCSGTLKKNMDILLGDQDLEWAIHDNFLTIMPIVTANTSQAVFLSSGAVNNIPLFVSPITEQFSNVNTGLIGVPSQSNGITTFKSLIIPGLVPGGLVKLLTEQISGYFKIRRAHYEGDTHGNKWQVTCDCIETSVVELPQQNVNGSFVV